MNYSNYSLFEAGNEEIIDNISSTSNFEDQLHMRLAEEKQSYYAKNEDGEHEQDYEERDVFRRVSIQQREEYEEERIHQQQYEEEGRIYEEHREARKNEEMEVPDEDDNFYSANEGEFGDNKLFQLNAIIEENELNENE